MEIITSKEAGEIASAIEPLPQEESDSKERQASHYPVPDKPLVVIEQGGRWTPFNIRDLWTYREVLYFLVWRDVKVRYKQAALGAAWAIIQPLFLMIVFTFFFGRLMRVSTGDIPYPLFVYAAIVPWSFFSNAVVSSSNSLTGNSNLITKIYFPRLLIPAASICAGLIDFAIASLLLAALLPYYDVELGWSVLLYPVLVLLTALLALAVGIWMSALNAKYRDVRHALPFIIQVWMFSTPIIYPLSIVPDQWRWLIRLNPMTGLVESFRSALFGTGVNWASLGSSALIIIIALVLFTYIFRRMEDYFADFI